MFSKATAPEGIEPFARYGSDIFVIWDKGDPDTDIYLSVALSVARALVIRERHAADRQKVGVNKVKQSLMHLEKCIEGLEDIMKALWKYPNQREKDSCDAG